MSITVSTDVFCDICMSWVHGTTGTAANAKVARQVARGHGWVRRRNDAEMIDVCDLCSSEAVRRG